MRDDHVAIIGGGFTGTLLAINLLRHDGPRATLIERRSVAARGAAYSTVHPEHLLNVRAANMSALPDEPDHFVRWLGRGGHDPAPGFVPRRIYGDYLAGMLAETIARSGDRVRLVQADAIDVEPAGRGWRVRLGDGDAIAADVVALAPGNLLPPVPDGLDVEGLAPGCYVSDPWRGDIAAGLCADDTVLILGTGLTMVDVALLLDARDFQGRIVALSRRGLVPRSHADGVAATVRGERPQPNAIALLRALRDRARDVDWRSAVDELRPFSHGLWRAMSLAERRRFLRHARAWWDVHRHRIAPPVADRIDRMRREGRLEIVAGRVTAATPTGRGARLTYRPRGGGEDVEILATRIVNGTGPAGNLAQTTEPLLRALIDRGMLRPDPLHIGIDVDQDSRAIDIGGAASDRLLVLGPMTRGAFWEIVAVPDIRRQVWSVARGLSNAHWVEGEGL